LFHVLLGLLYIQQGTTIFIIYTLYCSLVGGFAGFLMGRMKDRWVRQKLKSKGWQQQSSDHKFVNHQDTNTDSALYIGNNNSHTVHLPECRTIKQLTSCNKMIFASRQRAINLEYVSHRLFSRLHLLHLFSGQCYLLQRNLLLGSTLFLRLKRTFLVI